MKYADITNTKYHWTTIQPIAKKSHKLPPPHYIKPVNQPYLPVQLFELDAFKIVEAHNQVVSELLFEIMQLKEQIGETND